MIMLQNKIKVSFGGSQGKLRVVISRTFLQYWNHSPYLHVIIDDHKMRILCIEEKKSVPMWSGSSKTRYDKVLTA